MTIILTRARRIFNSFGGYNFIFNNCCRNSGFSNIYPWLNIVSTNRRIRIWFPNIFSSNSHIILIVSKFFKMSIILSWGWRLFFWPLLNLIFFNDCWWNSWFNLIDGKINIICPYWRIWIWFPFIFSSNRHLFRWVAEFF